MQKEWEERETKLKELKTENAGLELENEIFERDCKKLWHENRDLKKQAEKDEKRIKELELQVSKKRGKNDNTGTTGEYKVSNDMLKKIAKMYASAD